MDLFTPAERIRFADLRQRELNKETLEQGEAQELFGFIERIENAEHAALKNNKQRSEQQAAFLDHRIAALQELVQRREALATYLRQATQKADEERAAIDAAFAQLMAGVHEQAASSLR